MTFSMISLKMIIQKPKKKFVRDIDFNSEITAWVSLAQEQVSSA